ncbi:MAG: sulfatase-like hydrolase/transferase [bacterium]|nr:sulfatase-like hydrolase/transferase [bacterium]
MNRRGILVSASIVALSLGMGATGCGRAEPVSAVESGRAAVEANRPNIILITLCSFRGAHMGVAGYQRNTTPFLDSLADDGVYFENAVSASSWTKPAVASILTGLTPNVHGLTDVSRGSDIRGGHTAPKRILADGIVTLAECLRDAEYATAARVNNVHAGEFFNMTQGFDDAVTAHGMDTPAMLDDFASWLQNLDRGKPFFFFMLTRDVHIPYDPDYESYVRFNRSTEVVERERFPGYCRWLRKRVEEQVDHGRRVSPELRRKWIDLYDAELAQLDRALSRIPTLLADADCLANTLIVVTADHGERFFEHGRVGHSHVPDEAVVSIPLVFSGLDLPSGRRIRPVVRSIDVFATLAALAGAEPPDVLQGTSLLPLISGEADRLPKLTAFSSFMNAHHTLRDEAFKLHLRPDGRRELYDVVDDPAESFDLIDRNAEVAQRLDKELLRWLDQEEKLRSLVAHGTVRALTPELIEQLRSLGYVQ